MPEFPTSLKASSAEPTAAAPDPFDLYCQELSTIKRWWTAKAGCAGAEFTPVMFPTRKSEEARAIAICSGCPVRIDCLEHALVLGEDEGVWGGFTEKERIELHRQYQQQLSRVPWRDNSRQIFRAWLRALCN
jgi:hypothetical protein